MYSKEEYQVFVYGTLRKGEANHHLLDGALFITKTEIQGFEMLSFGTFPGIVPAENKEIIEAELYGVNETTLRLMDQLEDFYGVDHPENLYDRIMVKSLTGEEGLIYVLRPALINLPFFRKRLKKVSSGVWKS